MEKKITAGEVHKALVDSIELRWKPLAKGASTWHVPECHLCKLFLQDEPEGKSGCRKCPLNMIGQGCYKHNSAWKNWAGCTGYYWSSPQHAEQQEAKEAASNMINQLQKCLDTFFPGGCK